jgi:hypothetical protein
MFKWTVALDDDTVFDAVNSLERAAAFHGDSAVGRDMLGLASRLRVDYANHLEAEAKAVREATGLWRRFDAKGAAE